MEYRFVTRDACPVCHSSRPRTVYSSSFSEGGLGIFIRNWYKIDPDILGSTPYELQHCPDCQLVFQHHIGDAELMRDLYTKWCWQPEDPHRDYPGYLDHLSEYRLSPIAHELMALSSFTGMPLDRLKILDYGTGWGLWIRIAAKLGCDAHGLELSAPQVDYARQHGIKIVTDEELPQHRFHFINTEQVMEHVPDPAALLAAFADALAPGGIVKISVPSGERVESLIAALKSGSYRGDYKTIIPIQPLEHINTFKRHMIDVMAKQHGLGVVSPSLAQWYAFLSHPGTVSPRRPKKALKELVRPLYGYSNRSNIYAWLQKPL